jgi:NitT/TauT family transport system substrate-binding protein
MTPAARRLRTIVAGVACLAIPLAASQPAFSQAAEKVTVRFTWKLKGEYAPLFVALDKGYYKAEGLDVDLAEGSGAQTVLKLLASGNEKFGYGPAVSAAQAVSQGLPVKVVALTRPRLRWA